MNDTLKGLALGFLALFSIHAALGPRAERGAVEQTREAFRNTGTARARVEPRGLFGLLANDVWAVTIYGEGQKADSLPFAVYPRGGWKGRIRHLRLKFTDFTLNNYTVDAFEADLPFVKYDLGHALYRNRLQFRAAEPGPASVQIGAVNLRNFILKKYKGFFRDLEVWFQNRRVYIDGRVTLLGRTSDFTASGQLAAREERYLDLVAPVVYLDSRLLPPREAEALVKTLNPVLDTVNDLRLNKLFRITEVTIGDRYVIINGQVALPVRNEP
jgi:hypothetical protein